ncbi:hypothetical protein [Paenibacillus sp. J31TS4]|uniref:hypothetical protein n=1 Tax=Paenibacillus sp. J31TS4 TaxID=2807195 RepID=UPI001BCC3612|nr:hypothetical protein [Paenibacillus sp. J31TS4]
MKLELRDDRSESVSYDLVCSLMGSFDALLCSLFPQRKTLLQEDHANDRKRVGGVELAFNEETEKHFLSVAPSADLTAEGAFPLSGKAPLIKILLIVNI